MDCNTGGHDTPLIMRTTTYTDHHDTDIHASASTPFAFSQNRDGRKTMALPFASAEYREYLTQPTFDPHGMAITQTKMEPLTEEPLPDTMVRNGLYNDTTLSHPVLRWFGSTNFAESKQALGQFGRNAFYAGPHAPLPLTELKWLLSADERTKKINGMPLKYPDKYTFQPISNCYILTSLNPQTKEVKTGCEDSVLVFDVVGWNSQQNYLRHCHDRQSMADKIAAGMVAAGKPSPPPLQHAPHCPVSLSSKFPELVPFAEFVVSYLSEEDCKRFLNFRKWTRARTAMSVMKEEDDVKMTTIAEEEDDAVAAEEEAEDDEYEDFFRWTEFWYVHKSNFENFDHDKQLLCTTAISGLSSSLTMTAARKTNTTGFPQYVAYFLYLVLCRGGFVTPRSTPCIAPLMNILPSSSHQQRIYIIPKTFQHWLQHWPWEVSLFHETSLSMPGMPRPWYLDIDAVLLMHRHASQRTSTLKEWDFPLLDDDDDDSCEIKKVTRADAIRQFLSSMEDDVLNCAEATMREVGLQVFSGSQDKNSIRGDEDDDPPDDLPLTVFDAARDLIYQAGNRLGEADSSGGISVKLSAHVIFRAFGVRESDGQCLPYLLEHVARDGRVLGDLFGRLAMDDPECNWKPSNESTKKAMGVDYNVWNQAHNMRTISGVKDGNYSPSVVCVPLYRENDTGADALRKRLEQPENYITAMSADQMDNYLTFPNMSRLCDEYRAHFLEDQQQQQQQHHPYNPYISQGSSKTSYKIISRASNSEDIFLDRATLSPDWMRLVKQINDRYQQVVDPRVVPVGSRLFLEGLAKCQTDNPHVRLCVEMVWFDPDRSEYRVHLQSSVSLQSAMQRSKYTSALSKSATCADLFCHNPDCPIRHKKLVVLLDRIGRPFQCAQQQCRIPLWSTESVIFLPPPKQEDVHAHDADKSEH